MQSSQELLPVGWEIYDRKNRASEESRRKRRRTQMMREVMEEKGAMVGFASPDREAIVTVTVASAQDVDPAAFAAEMARGLGGSGIMEEDGVYSFAFGDNGVTVVHVAGTDLRVISIIGGHPALEGLIDSIEWR